MLGAMPFISIKSEIMNVYFDQSRHEKLHEGESRNHRWVKETDDDSIRYYNFRLIFS
jgi:hypothetical protein